MKAVVLETRDQEAAILLKDGTFRIVKGKYKVGETIEYRKKGSLIPRKWMPIAAAAILMLGTGGGLWYDANYVAYAEISLDVNPSIIYTVNRRSRVLEVRAVNDEASEAVNALQKEGIRFMPVDEAIEKTMTIFEGKGYLSAGDEDYVLLNVSADDDRMQESLASALETGMDHALESNPTMEFRIDRSDRETARRASENHMSTGRYAIWEQEGGERKPEEFAEMPIREVMGKPEADQTGNDSLGIREQNAPVGIQEQDVPAGIQEQDVPAGIREQNAPATPENQADQPLQPPQDNPAQNPEQKELPDLPEQEMSPPAPQEGLPSGQQQDGPENKGQPADTSAFPADQGPNGGNASQPPPGMNNGQMPGMPGGQPPK